MIITNSCYVLVGYFITSYPTRAHGTKWLKWILTTVYIFLVSASRPVIFEVKSCKFSGTVNYHLKSCDKLSYTVNWRLKMWMDWNNRHHKNVCFKQNLFKKPLRKARNFIEFHLFTSITFAQYCSWKPFLISTSFPGSLILPPPEASKERPWHTLVTCHFDNWEHQGGVLCNQQFVALNFVEFKVSRCDRFPGRTCVHPLEWILRVLKTQIRID